MSRLILRLLFAVIVMVITCALYFFQDPESTVTLTEESYNGNDSKPMRGACLVHFYANYHYYYEYKWLTEVVMSDIVNECGCLLKVHQLSDIVKEIEIISTDRIIISIDVNNPPNEFLEKVKTGVYDEILRDIVLFVVSDEYDQADDWYYDKFKTVYRSYYGHRGSIEMYENLEKDLNNDELLELTSSNSKFKTKVWWFPLGYSSSFMSSPLTKQKISTRSLLYFWSGSTGGKPERTDFLATLEKFPEIKQKGKLHTYTDFQGGDNIRDHLTPTDYSVYFHDAKFSPCPSGGSPEQFRISESFEAGAIPIVVKGHYHLRYLDDLGFKTVQIDHFDGVVDAMMRFSDDKLQEFQINNDVRWSLLKKRLARHVAVNVCKRVYY